MNISNNIKEARRQQGYFEAQVIPSKDLAVKISVESYVVQCHPQPCKNTFTYSVH